MYEGPRASLDLTHVLYDDSSLFSLGMAMISLSPILLMASYAALAVQTRELLIITMWAGQFFCELLNWLIKHAIKQDRPIQSIGNGYGFPSSHSQFMGYFTSFLICHLYYRHRFSSTGYPVIDFIWRILVYVGFLGWAGLVAYSRYYLGYHNAYQILWGIFIGAGLGISLYLLAEVIPDRYPSSALGRARIMLLDHPIIAWLEIRDGWAIWVDGGREVEWKRWRAQWEIRRSIAQNQKKG